MIYHAHPRPKTGSKSHGRRRESHEWPRDAPVKPAPFRYLRPESLHEALVHLTEHGDEAKILAGGQSLVAMMNLRLARPSLVIDIGGLKGLSYIREDEHGVTIGALTRHRHLEHYPAPLSGFEVLPTAAELVGHYSIRGRGTFGGSMAHADSAAEWCVLASLFEAQMVATSQRGDRTIPVEDFFLGLFSTALTPEEVLTEVNLTSSYEHTALHEYARRRGDFAVVTAAVGFDLDKGTIRRPRVVLGGVADRPVVTAAAQSVLEGAKPEAQVFEDAGRAAAASLQTTDDIHADAGLRRDLSASLIRSALASAMERRDGRA